MSLQNILMASRISSDRPNIGLRSPGHFSKMMKWALEPSQMLQYKPGMAQNGPPTLKTMPKRPKMGHRIYAWRGPNCFKICPKGNKLAQNSLLICRICIQMADRLAFYSHSPQILPSVPWYTLWSSPNMPKAQQHGMNWWDCENERNPL